MLRLVTLVAVMVMLPLGGAAVAAEPDADRARAEELVDQGLTFARSGEFREAIDKFEQANRLFPHPEIQHNLARAHEELHELRRAYYWFNQALKNDYTYAKDGRERLAKIERELRTRYARLTVRTTPSEVAVQLVFEGGEVENHISTPFQTWAPAGLVKVIGTNPGFMTGKREVELAAGEERQLNLVLQPLPKQGFIAVHVNVSGAKLYLGDELLTTLPMESMTYPAGIYDMKVVAEGYRPSKQQVVIRPDELTSVTVALEPQESTSVPLVGPEESSSPPPQWLGSTLVGLGAATVIAAVVLHVEAFRVNDEANNIPLSTPPIKEDDDEYARLHNKALDYQTYAAISYVGAGLLVAGGAVVLILAEDEPLPASEESAPAEALGVSLTPQVALTPEYIGVGGLLRF